MERETEMGERMRERGFKKSKIKKRRRIQKGPGHKNLYGGKK